jgi:hypothetical protein
MQYLLLLYVDESHPERVTGPQNHRAHAAVARDAVANGTYVAANALRVVEHAKTVRVRNGETIVTDGPFAETKEALGGYYLLDCASVEEAIAFASRLPPAFIGSVEVRPVFEILGWDGMIGLAAERGQA